MKKISKINSKLIITLAFVILAGIGYSQTKGSGNVVSQERNTGDFTGIKLTCSADLYITQGNSSVTVKADDNIQELIATNVDNDVLEISVKGKGFRSAKKLEVHISVPSLEKIKNSGSGDIKFVNVFSANELNIYINGSGDLTANFDVKSLELKVSGSGDVELSGVKGNLKDTNLGSGDLDAERLKLEDCYIKNSGSGDIELEGKTNNLTVGQAGSGDLDAYNFTSVNAYVTNSGSADITLHVVEILQVTLNGSGDLTYRGNPAKVDIKSNGSGDVYRK